MAVTSLPGPVIKNSVIGRAQPYWPAVPSCREAVVIGADELETPAQREENRRLQRPDVGIGKDSIIRRAIVDKDCRIGQGVQIVNRRGAQHEEGDCYVIRDGIVVIPNGMVVPDGTVI